MVYQNSASYLWIKGQTYYFNRRVPKDIQSYYSSSRIVICLKTIRRGSALRTARFIAKRLEDYWISLRLANIDIPAFHLLRREPQKLTESDYDSLSVEFCFSFFIYRSCLPFRKCSADEEAQKWKKDPLTSSY